MVGGNIINETIYCNMKNTTHENRGCHHYLGGRLRTKAKKETKNMSTVKEEQKFEKWQRSARNRYQYIRTVQRHEWR